MSQICFDHPQRARCGLFGRATKQKQVDAMTRHDNDSFNEWEDERMNIALPGARARQGASEDTQKSSRTTMATKTKQLLGLPLTSYNVSCSHTHHKIHGRNKTHDNDGWWRHSAASHMRPIYIYIYICLNWYRPSVSLWVSRIDPLRICCYRHNFSIYTFTATSCCHKFYSCC